jgi:hypothetical protein
MSNRSGTTPLVRCPAAGDKAQMVKRQGSLDERFCSLTLLGSLGETFPIDALTPMPKYRA